MVLVIPAISAPFHRTQLRKLLLPITEHVRFDAAQIANFTNSEIAFRGNGRERFLQLNQCSREEFSKSTPTPKQAQIVTVTFADVLFCHNNDIHLRPAVSCSVPSTRTLLAQPAEPLPWIWSLSLWLAWNVTTRRASIGIGSPVLGLRPGRGALVRI